MFLEILPNSQKNIFAGISFLIKLQAAEAATGGSLLEKVFLEISQNSQGNTCARVSGTTFLQNTSGWLLLRLETWNYQKQPPDIFSKIRSS